MIIHEALSKSGKVAMDDMGTQSVSTIEVTDLK
jgi:hypothetical protein